jgi:anti-sigma regulatory factor (Ser/Thr protein kinase)
MDTRKRIMEFEADFKNVDIARVALQEICAEYFGKDSESADDIVMAVNEAMNNAVEHTRSTTVKVEVTCTEAELRVSVISGGESFDPVAASADLDEEDMLERDEGGYGLYLIKELVDSFEYEYCDGCNVWKLGKQIKH